MQGLKEPQKIIEPNPADEAIPHSRLHNNQTSLEYLHRRTLHQLSGQPASIQTP